MEISIELFLNDEPVQLTADFWSEDDYIVCDIHAAKIIYKGVDVQNILYLNQINDLARQLDNKQSELIKKFKEQNDIYDHL